MRKFFKFFIIVLIFGAAYQFRDPLRAEFYSIRDSLQALFTKAPCSEPIPYVLGIFNPQFNISKSYFLSALADAEAIWEKPFGKPLFIYTPADSAVDVLKINLVYDYRQQATAKLASLGIIVKDDQASYETLRAKYLALKMQYTAQKNAFDMQAADFNQKKQAYNAEVDYWNKRGGAPQPEYDKVKAESVALNAQSQDLQAQEKSLNALVDEINALVVALNRLVSTLNLSVSQYNSINGARGESFEEGVYMSDGVSRAIDIYEFSSREKLVRVLAHELGHALDLDHLDDSKAIMYKLNQGNNSALTAADINALKTRCGIK